MAVAVYKPARQMGRFPRWGYLDKFYINELMPRSFMITILLCALGFGLWQGTIWAKKHFRKQSEAAGGPIKRRVAIQVVHGGSIRVREPWQTHNKAFRLGTGGFGTRSGGRIRVRRR